MLLSKVGLHPIYFNLALKHRVDC